MEIVERTIEYSGDPTYTIAFTGDTHIGTMHHDRKHWLRDVATINDDDNCLWLHLGDAVEAITPSDKKRWAGNEIDQKFTTRLDDLPQAQMECFEQDVWDISDKCIGLVQGNHEQKYAQYHYGNLTRRACDALHVPYLSDTALVRLTFRRLDEDGNRNRSHVVTLYVQHGSGGGATTGAKVNRIENLPAGFSADIFAWGHVHKRVVWPFVQLSIPSNGKLQLVERELWGVLSGSYLKSYQEGASSYGQRAAYRPVSLGCAYVRIRPLMRKVMGDYGGVL